MEKETLGFIGLGTMGVPMVRNLRKAGFSVAVWNRTDLSTSDAPACRNRHQELTESGAVIVASLAELAEAARILCLCVSNDEALQECVQKLRPYLGSEHGLIDFSTVAPATAVTVSAELAKQDIPFADAPVTGGDVGAKNATLTIMVGGDAEFFNRIRPVLETVGKKIVHLGAVGNGQKLKAINQVAVAISIIGMSEAMVMAQNFGFDLPTVLDVLGSGAAGSWSIQNYAPRILKGELQPGFAAAHMLKDLKIVEKLLAESELELPGAQLATRLYDRFCDHSRPTGLAGDVKNDRELGNHALITDYRGWQQP